jgi:ADP-heptose:LPS heptosyltransferase
MRILFITATRIGDAILSTGVLDHLLKRHPDARVTVVAGPAAAPLFRRVPGLERLIAMRKRRWHWHWFELWGRLAARRWDLVVDLRATGTAYFLWAGRRCVIGRRKSDSLHRVEELAALLDLPESPAPRLWLGDADRQVAAKLVPDGGPVLGVGPAANWRGKQWRGERFAELVTRLTSAEGLLPGARVAVFAAAHEREQAKPVLEALPKERRIDLVGEVDLPQAGACLSRCALFVGNDSGLMHLAAATGTPTLGLFGPSPHERYRPWGAKAAYVRTPESMAELIGHADYDHRTTDTLMDSLSVDAVEAAARDLWGRVG